MTDAATATNAAIYNLEQKFIAAKAQGAKPTTIGISLSGEGGGDWHLVIADAALQIKTGAAEQPTTTIKATAADFLAVLNGTLDGTRAMMTGKLRASGDLRALAKFGEWFAF
jgi:putative sterol carrier protein